jgi:hypothetical protein
MSYKGIKLVPVPSIWVVYQDGRPCVWCLSKADAEKYRRWGRRKVNYQINIRRYNIDERMGSKYA